MTAAMLVLEPIFEADLPPELYAYRSGETPNRRWSRWKNCCFAAHPEVVDADLADYFGSTVAHLFVDLGRAQHACRRQRLVLQAVKQFQQAAASRAFRPDRRCLPAARRY